MLRAIEGMTPVSGSPVTQCCGRGGTTGEPPDDVSDSEGVIPVGTMGYGPNICESGTKPPG